jgi:hypothetical protein
LRSVLNRACSDSVNIVTGNVFFIDAIPDGSEGRPRPPDS